MADMCATQWYGLISFSTFFLMVLMAVCRMLYSGWAKIFRPAKVVRATPPPRPLKSKKVKRCLHSPVPSETRSLDPTELSIDIPDEAASVLSGG